MKAKDDPKYFKQEVTIMPYRTKEEAQKAAESYVKQMFDDWLDGMKKLAEVVGEDKD